jgi:hypothetical protein
MYPRYSAGCPVVQVFFVSHNLVYSQYVYLTLLDFYIGLFHSSGRVILGPVGFRQRCLSPAHEVLEAQEGHMLNQPWLTQLCVLKS